MGRNKKNPTKLAEEYKYRWLRLQNEGQHVYYEIRDSFNKTKSPYDFLFLSRTCTNGLIRFNTKGEFNNSLHLTRKGILPNKLEEIILDWSKHIQNTTFLHGDYKSTTIDAKDGDVIYLDPPYFNTKGMYYGNIDFESFLEYLETLNKKNIKYILSYDGKRDDVDYTRDIPKELYKRHTYIHSGNSTFKKIMSKEKSSVLESLYLNY